jgi:hypothetical protein
MKPHNPTRSITTPGAGDVAALFVRTRTVYNTIPGVDCWPEKRDARTYDGPHPIVAHPPCASWSRLWAVSRKRTRPGQDDTCGLRAVAQVRKFGGVLEQPAHSRLWWAAYLPAPGLADLWGGHSVELDQAEWGHTCTKPTWLYIVSPATLPPPPHPGRRGRSVTAGTEDQRLMTPVQLALALVAIARAVRPV